MKKIIYLLFFSLAQFGANSQDSLTSQLVQDFISKFKDSSTIYYIDSQFKFYRTFSHFAQKGTVKGFINLKYGNGEGAMQFTRRELKEIDRKNKEQLPGLWPPNFFFNSIRLPIDSLVMVITDTAIIDNTVRYDFRRYYLFSKPVFIRNNSVAIFRFAYMFSHSMGIDYIVIYAKENEVWTNKLIIRAGAW